MNTEAETVGQLFPGERSFQEFLSRWPALSHRANLATRRTWSCALLWWFCLDILSPWRKARMCCGPHFPPSVRWNPSACHTSWMGRKDGARCLAGNWGTVYGNIPLGFRLGSVVFLTFTALKKSQLKCKTQEDTSEKITNLGITKIMHTFLCVKISLLSTPMKRQFARLDKKARFSYGLPKRNPLQK